MTDLPIMFTYKFVTDRFTTVENLSKIGNYWRI